MKRVQQCGLCPAVYRESLMYSVNYTGYPKVGQSSMIPPQKVDDQPLRICRNCYEACGYVVKRGKRRKQAELPLLAEKAVDAS